MHFCVCVCHCGCSAATPPLYRADNGLSRVSSSGSVSSMADDAAIGLNMAVMADLVQEKMCDLSEANNGLCPCLSRLSWAVVSE